MSSQDQINDDTDDASHYVQTLVRDHMETVMDYHRDPQPPPASHMDDAEKLFMIQVIVIALEQDKEVVLACLVKAAVDVQNRAVGEESTAVNDFLQQTVDTVSSRGATLAFLQSVLETLIQCDEAQRSASSLAASSTSEAPSGIEVSVGRETFEVPFQDLLEYFWTSTHLDTPCHSCHQLFLDGPPIRTFARYDSQSSTTSDIRIRILNRHFACLQSDRTFFIPVSHVWDASIRVANDSGTHNDEAATLLINTLEALFEGAKDAYDPGVEFWHDYFSVPQWQTAIKDSILLYLPSIYSLAEEILVHMADVSPSSVAFLIIGSQTQADLSLLQAFKVIPLLRTLCNSQWMQRMWVTLEYSQCKSACIMDQSNQIWRHRNENGLFARDTFTQLVNGGQAMLIGLFRHAKSIARTLSLPGEFLGGIASRENGPPQLCLGEALELVARKQCFLFRDRFFAIHVLLNRTVVPGASRALSPTESDICSWVWRSALTKGDYSPLLLQPRENVAFSNPASEMPSWLVGHGSLDAAQWVLGNQLSSPDRALVSTALPVIMAMDLAGTIEKIHYLDAEESGEITGVDWAIRLLNLIADAGKTTLSPERLVDGINRIFPFDILHKTVASSMVGMRLSFAEREEQDPEFRNKLELQLDSYRNAPDNSDHGRVLRQEAAEEISQILQLDKHIMGNITDQVTRLTRSRHIARTRKERGAVNGEPICEVRCPGCREVSPFRLDLRETGQVGDKLYRIFGSLENGVGLVVQKGRISGRMLYGPPSCDCRFMERVQID
jgi:hypothetical protein